MNDNSLTIEAIPAGRNTVKLTARINGEPIHVDELNLTKDTARRRFIGTVCEGRPGIDADAVAGELLRIAADLASKPTASADSIVMPEIDVSSMVRPERFITPEVSGLAVPTMTVMGDKPVGRWVLYLRWSDGKRQRSPMTTAIDLPEKQTLWIHPEPAEPAATMQSGWSQSARSVWLGGAIAPSPADLFKRICERIAHFIDLPKEHAAGTVSTLALWTLLSYCFQAWPAVPYLFVGGPLGSGKSRVFEILARLVFRPLSSSNLTAAALFRTLHNQGGVLLLDEAERLKQTQSPDVGEILSMLLAGYKRGGHARY